MKLSPRLLSHLKVNSLLRYRGKRAGKPKWLQSDDRVIPVLNRPRQMITLWRARKRTLTSLINCDSSRLPPFSHLKPTATRFALFNARSVRNKRLLIKDYVVDNDVDIFALTETWLHPDNRDDQVIGDLIPVGYSFYHVPRQFGNGGGVGILVKNGFYVEQTIAMNRQFDSFEFIDLLIKFDSCRDIRVLVIYRPPSCNFSLFIDEFGCLLEQYITDSSFLLVAGDFNYHIDDAVDKPSYDFCSLLGSFNLKQHVDKPTHSAGHILDLLITREEPLVFNISVCDPDLSDHFVVHCDILITKPSFERKEIEFRKLKTIDTKMISDELFNSSLLLHPPEDLHQLVSLYNSVLADILNKHTPVRRRVITIRPAAPWYTEEIKGEKRI